MTLTVKSVDQWLDIALAATNELADVGLGGSAVTIGKRRCCAPTDLPGAYIPLFTGGATVHVGIIAAGPARVALTRALLMMEDDEDDPSSEDVADAVSEIVNIMAGSIQRQIGEAVERVKLGLPKFVGGVPSMQLTECAVSTVAFDGIETELVVMAGNIDFPETP